jgi:ABC-type bacteriocin/lantibiotic exporter with double-glycine peptidase domain
MPRLGQLWLAARAGQGIHRDYGIRYIERLLRLPLKVFDSRCVPGFVMRIAQVEQVQLAISESGVLLLTESLMFLAALGVILAERRYQQLLETRLNALIKARSRQSKTGRSTYCHYLQCAVALSLSM